MQALRKFLGLTWAERGLVLEALLRLGLARLAVKALPFQKVVSLLGEKGRETPQEPLPQDQADTARRVSLAIRRTRRFTPWDSNCLAQAIAACQMLRRRGVPTTAYLGAALGGPKGMIAHAWVRSGKQIITGFEGMRRYGIVARYAQGQGIKAK